MKKFAKISLVAAVAVAGLSSTVSAKPLEEAIKGVDVSGSIVYRHNATGTDNGTATGTASINNNYKAALSLKAPVNDTVSVATRFIVGGADGGFATLDTGVNADQTVGVALSNVNFTAKTDVATVIAGKQNLETPWTKGTHIDGNEQTGTGALALIPVGGVTLAAAYFNQNNITGYTTDDISAVAVIAPVAGFNLQAWYLDMGEKFTTYTLSAGGKVADIANVEARYTVLEVDNATTDNSNLTLKADAKFGTVGVKAVVAMTGKDGGLTALDTDAVTTNLAWNVNSNNKIDATMVHLVADMDVMSGLNLALNYATVDYKTGTRDDEDTEMFLQATYKMGKNLTSYARYGQREVTTGTTTAETTPARIQIAYTF